MNDMRCETAREWIPDLVGSRLDAAEAARVSAHLDTCADCRAEADLVRLLFAGRPDAPAGLSTRIRAAVHADRQTTGRHPWWGLAAAAVAALALGIGVASTGVKDTTTVPGYVAAGTNSGDAWYSDDGMIAGAPALDGLSNDALQTLLEELGSNGKGGSA